MKYFYLGQGIDTDNVATNNATDNANKHIWKASSSADQREISTIEPWTKKSPYVEKWWYRRLQWEFWGPREYVNISFFGSATINCPYLILWLWVRSLKELSESVKVKYQSAYKCLHWDSFIKSTNRYSRCSRWEQVCLFLLLAMFIGVSF